MPTTGAAQSGTLTERALEAMRHTGNPFRNYFARNPDDEVCARYHVPELFALEREQLLGVVELYRATPGMHSEVVPILGNKGAGKTHLLHSIKHGSTGGRQLLVSPGVFQKDADFLEYLLYQLIDTILGGSTQKGARPLEFVGVELTRGFLRTALAGLTNAERLELFPAPGLARWTRKLGLGSSQAQERTQWLCDQLASAEAKQTHFSESAKPNPKPKSKLVSLCLEAGIDPERACALVSGAIERNQPRDTAGLMRRHIHQGFARYALLGDESELANFLTYGFAELDFQVRPTRQDLVLTLCKVLMEVFQTLKVPVVVAFDQLEDLLLVRRTDDGHRVAEAFFAGIVQAMHRIDGICFLIFAERGLWNRFVPSLDGYIQDRLNNPVHVPGHGTIKTLRLEAPAVELVSRVAKARLDHSVAGLPGAAELPPLFPFNEEQVVRIARTEPTLRDMLQQFRHLFDHLVFGSDSPIINTEKPAETAQPNALPAIATGYADPTTLPAPEMTAETRLPLEELPIVKSVIVVETPASDTRTASVENHDARRKHNAPGPRIQLPPQFTEMWEQEQRAARRQLEPEGALTGATRELQAGLGAFLHACHENGVKVGPWRLHHVVGELSFGEHPTYGVVTIAHWVCKDGQPWKVGIGLFLGRGPGKPKDLETKLLSMEAQPTVIDHLILLRPEDDMTLSGKSKTLWQEAERRGRHARLEALSLEAFATLYGFPRWLASVSEAQPEGQPLPNLADLLQERCEKLLEQVCMPVQQ